MSRFRYKEINYSKEDILTILTKLNYPIFFDLKIGDSDYFTTYINVDFAINVGCDYLVGFIKSKDNDNTYNLVADWGKICKLTNKSLYSFLREFEKAKSELVNSQILEIVSSQKANINLYQIIKSNLFPFIKIIKIKTRNFFNHIFTYTCKPFVKVILSARQFVDIIGKTFVKVFQYRKSTKDNLKCSYSKTGLQSFTYKLIEKRKGSLFREFLLKIKYKIRKSIFLFSSRFSSRIKSLIVKFKKQHSKRKNLYILRKSYKVGM